MNFRDDLDKFFQVINSSLYKLDSEEYAKYFDKVYRAGKNKIYQKNLSETKIFDKEWVRIVESYFPSIDKITRNPRSALRYDDDVVAIEKAKKINSQSVRHLASHTHLIKSVEDDFVVPKKILTVTAEQEFNVYENRFIATLINRLFLFVRNRYLIIKENVESFQKDHVYTESNFEIDNTNIEMKIDFTLTRDLDDATINEQNHELLARVEKLERLVEALKGSQFMRMMKNTAVVRPPIMKTNVILKNPDFKDAYNLWLFLDKYSTLAYDVKVKEKNIAFDQNFDNHIKNLNLVTFATIAGDQKIRNELFNIDDGNEFTKRSTKLLKNNADDFVDNPEELQIEDTTLNEYFLNKYKQLLKESEEEIKQNGRVSDDEALKRALRKTTLIVNSLYNAIFEFETEQNVFNYLITDEDAEKEYEKKRYQIKFAKVIREIKEVDYNQSMRRERKLLKELSKLNNKIIKIRQDKIVEATDRTNIDKLKQEIETRTQENKDFKSQIAIMEDNNTLLDYEKDALEELRQRVLGEVKEEVNKFKEEYKKQLDDEQAKLKEDVKSLRQEVKEAEKLLADLLRQREKLQKERLLEEERLAKEKELEEKRRLKEEADRKRKAQFDALRELIRTQKSRLGFLRKEISKVQDELGLSDNNDNNIEVLEPLEEEAEVSLENQLENDLENFELELNESLESNTDIEE